MARGGRQTRIAALIAVAVLFAGAAGCSDDSGGTGTPKEDPSPATSSASAEPSEAEGPEDEAAAEKEIKENWKNFFDPKTDLDAKADLLEDGDQLAPLMQAFSGDERMKQVESQVTKVEFTSAEEAKVTYGLTLKGETVVPSGSGVAVLQDGTWKVAKKSLCGLVELSGSPAPGC